MRRVSRALLLLAGLARPLAAPGQQEQAFEPPAFKPHFTFRWDALGRYDNISHLHFRADIGRGRFEVRPEVGFQFSERFRIGVRGIGSLGTDQNSDNSLNFDNYRSRGAWIERYYLEARPGNFVLDAGAFGMPLLATEMLWDHDIQTPGAAVSYELKTGGASTLLLSAAGFYGPQSQGDHTRIGAGQAVWRTGDRDRLELQVAASYWQFEPDDLKLFFADGRPNLIRQNYASGRDLLSDYRIADVIVRLRFALGTVPVLVSLDGLKNFGVRGAAKEDGEAEAFEGSLTLGRVGTPGDWRFFYTFQYVERDALIGAYNTDDWWFHTWYRGHRIGAAVTVLPNVFLQCSTVFQKRLDRHNYLNRVLVDLVKMF